jgi:alpha-D-ribose 1-methylphosphonate 5-triphosphate diphosphatase
MPSVAFNDHTSLALLDPAMPMQDRPFEHDPAFPLTDMSAPSFAPRMEARARRSHMSTGEYVALLARVWERRTDVPADIARVAGLARAAGAPMLSHDDSQPETRRFFRDLGARTAEFPMHERVLHEARAAGDLIVFGAPNAMRGGSHLGSPGAGAMVARGLCDILASDYYYPAMLGAVARLLADGVAPLHLLWRLVAENPAQAMGLADRGRIAPGLRADLVLIDWPEGEVPAVRRTIVADRDGIGPGGP